MRLYKAHLLLKEEELNRGRRGVVRKPEKIKQYTD